MGGDELLSKDSAPSREWGSFPVLLEAGACEYIWEVVAVCLKVLLHRLRKLGAEGAPAWWVTTLG